MQHNILYYERENFECLQQQLKKKHKTKAATVFYAIFGYHFTGITNESNPALKHSHKISLGVLWDADIHVMSFNKRPCHFFFDKITWQPIANQINDVDDQQTSKRLGALFCLQQIEKGEHSYCDAFQCLFLASTPTKIIYD